MSELQQPTYTENTPEVLQALREKGIKYKTDTREDSISFGIERELSELHIYLDKAIVTVAMLEQRITHTDSEDEVYVTFGMININLGRNGSMASVCSFTRIDNFISHKELKDYALDGAIKTVRRGMKR